MTHTQEPDRLLLALVNMINVGEDVTADSPNRTTVTLLTAGGLISGDLIPAATWLRRVAEQSGELAPLYEKLADRLEANGANRRAGLAALEAADEVDQATRDQFHDSYQDAEYAHLDRAAWLTGGGTQDYPVPSDGTRWRIRLTDVIGWYLGAHNADYPEREGATS